jgi:dihydrofolate reductase
VTDCGEAKVSAVSAAYTRPRLESIGALVVGRHVFDLTNGWEGIPRGSAHVVVVSHRPKPDGRHPEAPFHFVNDVAAAIAMAKELAGTRTVEVAAGDVGGQAFALGLVDAVSMDVVPVVFGSGKRYFGSVDSQHMLETPMSSSKATASSASATGPAAKPESTARMMVEASALPA